MVTRIAGESGPCSAWVTRSAATSSGSAVSSARTMPSEGPAGRSIPTKPGDLELGRGHPGVAGADDPIDRGERRLEACEPVRERPDRLRAAGDEERIDLEQTGRPEQDGVDRAVGVGGRGNDDLGHARDPGRHDRHQERRRVRRGAARDVGSRSGRGAASAARSRSPARSWSGSWPGAGCSRTGRCDRSPGRGPRRSSRPRRSRAARISARSITRRPSAAPPPNRPLASISAGAPRRATSATIVRAADRTRSSGTAPRRTSDARSAESAAALDPRSSRRRRTAGGVPLSGVPLSGVRPGAAVTGRSSRSGGRGFPMRRLTSTGAAGSRRPRLRRPRGSRSSRHGRAG